MFGLLVLAGLVGAAPAARPAPVSTPAAAVSRERGEALRVRLLEFDRRFRARRDLRGAVPAGPATAVVTQDEVNSYVTHVLRPQMPAGLSDVGFSLGDDRIEVRALVDLEQLKSKLGATSVWNPLALLTGQMSVELKGRLKSDGGFGTFEFDDIRVGPMALPPSLLAQSVAASTRTAQNPHGFDILAPFRLPYGLKRLKVRQGRLLLDF